MCPGFAKVLRRHHCAKRGLDRTFRVGQKTCDAGKRLVLLRIEDVKDGSDQQGVTGLLPVVPPFQRSFGIDEHVGDILDVANLSFPLSYFQERIVGRTP